MLRHPEEHDIHSGLRDTFLENSVGTVSTVLHQMQPGTPGVQRRFCRRERARAVDSGLRRGKGANSLVKERDRRETEWVSRVERRGPLELAESVVRASHGSVPISAGRDDIGRI